MKICRMNIVMIQVLKVDHVLDAQYGTDRKNEGKHYSVVWSLFSMLLMMLMWLSLLMLMVMFMSMNITKSMTQNRSVGTDMPKQLLLIQETIDGWESHTRDHRRVRIAYTRLYGREPYNYSAHTATLHMLFYISHIYSLAGKRPDLWFGIGLSWFFSPTLLKRVYIVQIYLEGWNCSGFSPFPASCAKWWTPRWL